MKYLNYLLLMFVLSLTIQITPQLAWADTPKLDAAEATHLIFMREEEKLARDVYLVFGEMYQDNRIFDQIAMLSEQEHTTAVLSLLNRYGIPDPNPMADNLPESIGLFTGEVYGAYFLEKFNELIDWGSRSELDALYVGAFIEELDMHDIVVAPTVIAEADNGIDEDGCGLVYTDESEIRRVYEHLLAGSENHLRAFVGQIEAVIGEGNYKAQYLTQEEVDAILGR